MRGSSRSAPRAPRLFVVALCHDALAAALLGGDLREQLEQRLALRQQLREPPRDGLRGVGAQQLALPLQILLSPNVLLLILMNLCTQLMRIFYTLRMKEKF